MGANTVINVNCMLYIFWGYIFTGHNSHSDAANVDLTDRCVWWIKQCI
uniref:Uncharacterized protein n=1 Tax=Setaria italica TaxID=4555 RepID=K4ANY3_SETIT